MCLSLGVDVIYISRLCLHLLSCTTDSGTCAAIVTIDASPRSPTEESTENGHARQSPSSEAGSAAAAAGLDGVVARMRELATNRGDALRRSKRDRGTLRSRFRDLVGVVEVRVWAPGSWLHQMGSRAYLLVMGTAASTAVTTATKWWKDKST